MLNLWYLAAASLVVGILWQRRVVSGTDSSFELLIHDEDEVNFQEAETDEPATDDGTTSDGEDNTTPTDGTTTTASSDDWTTREIITVAVLGGLCVIAIAMSTVAITLVARMKRRLSTADKAETSITKSSRGSKENRAGEKSRQNQYEMVDSWSSHDSGKAVERMGVIQGAMEKAPDIDWSIMRNFKMKNGSSSYNNPVYSRDKGEETAFPGVHTTF